MNKRVITSISLLVAGVVIGVTVSAVCLSTVERQKASQASQLQATGVKLASKTSASTVDTATTKAKISQQNSEKNSETSTVKTSAKNPFSFAQADATKPTAAPVPNPGVATAPASNVVQPNILHQAAMQSVATQGQWSANQTTTMPVVDGQPVPTFTTTTYVIQQPPREFTVTPLGIVQEVGASRAVDTPDAMPMPIGRNGLQQNPCVDPPSTYGKAFNRGM
jgi:hypothetical protein